jgi:heavy metal sensor kinase
MPIRIRLAAASAVVTLVLFGVAGFLFVRSFRDGLVGSLDRSLGPQATTLARQVRAGTAALGDESTIATSEVVAQVLDREGRIVQSTREAGERAVIDPGVVARARRDRVFVDVEVGSEPEPFRVLAAPVLPTAGGRSNRIVVIGTSREETETAVARVERAAMIGGSAAVVIAGIGAWLLAGAALRPVERMRRQASAISAHDTSARLPVPATRDEIAALGTTMNLLLSRLQGALDRQRNFVADAGHELRTPLAVLQTELELAARPDRARDELEDAIEHAGTETQRLSRLADELLFLARGDVMQSQIRREPMQVRALVERAVDGARARARDHGVMLVVEGDGSIDTGLDPHLVRRAVDNLLDNALRYAPRGSTITVVVQRAGVAAEGDGVEIAVADRGPGFPDEFLPHAFERFRRADDARSRDGGGAGLGLSIVLAVAEAHGGTATARNRAGGGAVVEMRLGSPSV